MLNYYVIKQNGVQVGSGWADADNFNAGYPEGFEWADAPPPEPAQPKRLLTHLEYMNRFTDEELEGIYGADSNPAVKVWIKKFEASSEVNLDDQRTIDGLAKMVTAGLLAANRPVEILA